MEFFKCCWSWYSLAFFFFSCTFMILSTFNSSTIAVIDHRLSVKSDEIEIEHTVSLQEYDGAGEEEIMDDDGAGDFNRRSLFWQRLKHMYISYGALYSNRIPCPPRSGRSYYTHNCYFADGPAHPYVRGCSTITRCRR